MKTLRPIMFVGTGSDVGKSVINTAFCRLFKQDGYSPAPFKAQNMSPNSYVTRNGLEIGRAQAAQAEACGIDCRAEMNPILLKPTSDNISQVIINGKPSGYQSARQYFDEPNRNLLFTQAMNAYQQLAQHHSPMVIEGAGSISEINLWDRDITNMRVAMEVNAATYLIADIDRGGIFGSLYGTIQLLPPEHKKLIKGIIINKFRGDSSLFDEGRKILEKITKVPVVGIIPYFTNLFVEQEDSLALEHINNQPMQGKINIGILLLKQMSNFTDFDNFHHIPEANLFYIKEASQVKNADILIIPNSKNPEANINYLHKSAIAQAIQQHHHQKKPLFGIGTGYQIMSNKIFDNQHNTKKSSPIKGLGILPTTTTLKHAQKREQCKFTFTHMPHITGEGYTIDNEATNSQQPLLQLENNKTDGYFLNHYTWATNLHGIFHNTKVIESVLQLVQPNIKVTTNHKEIKEKGYNQLAQLIRKNVDINYIYKTLQQ